MCRKQKLENLKLGKISSTGAAKEWKTLMFAASFSEGIHLNLALHEKWKRMHHGTEDIGTW